MAAPAELLRLPLTPASSIPNDGRLALGTPSGWKAVQVPEFLEWIELNANPGGSQGYTGAQGPAGNGAQGYRGFQGRRGFQGNTGTTGTTGATGDRGPQGNRGFQGRRGYGDTGATGDRGPQGYRGLQGRQGYQGYRGFQGYVGGTGNQGARGLQGLRGYQGRQGNPGNNGDTGGNGPQGFRGYQGRQGTPGDYGTPGDRGFQGYTGTRGFQGWNGGTGAPGDQGLTGAQGYRGHQGYDGDRGFQGYNGTPGAQGRSGRASLPRVRKADILGVMEYLPADTGGNPDVTNNGMMTVQNPWTTPSIVSLSHTDQNGNVSSILGSINGSTYLQITGASGGLFVAAVSAPGTNQGSYTDFDLGDTLEKSGTFDYSPGNVFTVVAFKLLDATGVAYNNEHGQTTIDGSATLDGAGNLQIENLTVGNQLRLGGIEDLDPGLGSDFKQVPAYDATGTLVGYITIKNPT